MTLTPPSSRYKVKVPLRFLVLSFISCVLVAFVIGRVSLNLVVHAQLAVLKEVMAMSSCSSIDDVAGTTSKSDSRMMELPTPVLPAGKILPQTTYSSKAYDTARSSINSRWVVTEAGKDQCVDIPDHQCPRAAKKTDEQADAQNFVVEDNNNNTGEDGEDLHMPQGQHLLVDIMNVDAVFLNSEERLASVMLEMVNECGLTLLSYHCHGLTPSGVSCAGVLLESHVSFHTWPVEGVITLDLFTCGDQSLLPIVPLIERLFSVPRPGNEDTPQMVWAHKYRGFGDNDEEEKSGLTDFFNFPLGIMTDYKKQICSEQTEFQRVDVVDVLRPRYQKMDAYRRSGSGDELYESKHPDLFEPDRLVFLDGVLQSRRSGDAAYHEALVHPGMFAHPHPKRVAIIGGGEGATLREVLKHKTVEKLIMIEIDEKMVSLSREFLPDWSDCSMLTGKNGSCFEDPRVEVYYEDAFAWFIDRFGQGKEPETEPFDVIIMDALDPQIQKAFVDALYDGGPFMGSLPAAMEEGGILIAQVGEASRMQSPAENIGLNRNRVNFIRTLGNLGFNAIRDYEETHSGFSDPWRFIVASRSLETMGRWDMHESALVYEIRKRMLETKNGQSPLRFFDGATMASYAFPSKASELVFCRQHLNLFNCKYGHRFDPNKENIPITLLEAQTVDGQVGVFASSDIPSSAYIGLEKAINGVSLKTPHSRLLRNMEENQAAKNIRKVITFFNTYGQKLRKSDVVSEQIVQTSLHAFIHKEECEGITNNIDVIDIEDTEEEVTENSIYYYYDPMRDRQTHIFHTALLSNSYIPKGSELRSTNREECRGSASD